MDTTLKIQPNGQLHFDLPPTTKDFGSSDAYADNVGWTTLLGGPLGGSHTGIQVNPINSLQASAVYACVRILVGDIAKLPLRLMKQGKDGIWLEDHKHSISRLLRKPNKRMTQHDMVTHMVMSQLLVGNSYTAVSRNENGAPTGLVPLIPSVVSIREDSSGNLFYYAVSRLFDNNSQAKTFTEDDIIHVRNMSFDGGIRGSSPTQMASEVLGLALATQQLAASLFGNGAHFQGLLTTDQPLGKEAIDQTSEQWNGRSHGMRNAYKTPVVSRGLKFQPISQNATETQLLESRRLAVEECARIYGVPLYKLSSVEKMGYNSIDAQSQDYIDSTLIPITNPIEQALAKVLLFDREFDNYKFSFDFSALEKGDLKTRTEHLHTLLTDGVLNRNEVRREFNLPSIGEQGEIYTAPLNVGVLGDTSGLPVVQIDAPVKETISESEPATKPVKE